jgi:hypothetical protein
MFYNEMMRTWIGILLGIVCFGTVAMADDFHRAAGQYIRLVTDVSTDEASVLVVSFDTAVKQWAKFYELEPDTLNDWSVDALVMRDPSKFQKAEMIPVDLPDFPFGYAQGNRVYVKAQPGEYYTRHLLLHEGSHSLAFHLFDGAGPMWFMEGTAEWLSTHRGVAGETKVGVIPEDRSQVPYWGRFKAIEKLRDNHQVPTIETVMQYQPNLLGDVPIYGCAWSAIHLMWAYPEYRPLILKSARRGQKTSLVFNRLLHQDIAPQWPIFSARWRLWMETIDYGFDPVRHRTSLSIEDPLWDGKPRDLSIASDLGWQSCGVRIPAGKSVTIKASGKITLASEPKPWDCYPPGITIKYHRGKPLGQLIAVVLPNMVPEGETLAPLERMSIGDQATIHCKQASWIALKVNEAPGDLADNRGQYKVRLQP